jgi:hypothetical protein
MSSSQAWRHLDRSADPPRLRPTDPANRLKAKALRRLAAAALHDGGEDLQVIEAAACIDECCSLPNKKARRSQQ